MRSIPAIVVGIAEKWRVEWPRPGFRIDLAATVILVVIAALGTLRVSNFVQARTGVVLPDPVLAMFEPRPLQWQTHVMMYGLVFSAIVHLLPTPRRFLMAWQGWAVVLCFRMLGMLIAPFEAPPAIIPILDPLAQQAADVEPIIDDLFFSGHTATAFLLVLFARRWWVKMLFLAVTVSIAAAIMLQHVHYTVDIYCAPVFAYVSYRMVLNAHPGAEDQPDA